MQILSLRSGLSFGAHSFSVASVIELMTKYGHRNRESTMPIQFLPAGVARAGLGIAFDGNEPLRFLRAFRVLKVPFVLL